jgi:hypothetical protein
MPRELIARSSEIKCRIIRRGYKAGGMSSSRAHANSMEKTAGLWLAKLFCHSPSFFTFPAVPSALLALGKETRVAKISIPTSSFLLMKNFWALMWLRCVADVYKFQNTCQRREAFFSSLGSQRLSYCECPELSQTFSPSIATHTHSLFLDSVQFLPSQPAASRRSNVEWQ